jgi:NAD(P)-dependent dehydrogenase (short-subunit alcohol dehydrogenase family)
LGPLPGSAPVNHLYFQAEQALIAVGEARGEMTADRRALVVGASRGLGLGLAAELQQRGWDVVATVRDQAGERRLQALSNRPSGSIQAERVDINDDASVEALRRRLDGGVFDLVFANAGIALDRDDRRSRAARRPPISF